MGDEGDRPLRWRVNGFPPGRVRFEPAAITGDSEIGDHLFEIDGMALIAEWVVDIDERAGAAVDCEPSAFDGGIEHDVIGGLIRAQDAEELHRHEERTGGEDEVGGEANAFAGEQAEQD